MGKEREEWRGQQRDQCNGAKQPESHYQREPDTQTLRAGTVRFGQLIRENGDQIRLSMPSTTSITTRVARDAHAGASLTRTMR